MTGFSEFQSEAKLGSIVKLHAGSYGLEPIDPEGVALGVNLQLLLGIENTPAIAAECARVSRIAHGAAGLHLPLSPG